MFYPRVFSRGAVILFLVMSYSGCAQLDKKVPSEGAVSAEQQARAQEEAAFAKAVEAHREGDLPEAEALYQELLTKYPDNIPARINLAQLAMSEEQSDKAQQQVDEALAKAPASPQVLTLAGVLAREKGEFDQAEDYYRQALSAKPDYIPALKNLGILLDLYRGRLEEALALYEQAQGLLEEPDPKLKDWIFDIKRRIGDS